MRVIIFTRADGGMTVRNLPSGATDEMFASSMKRAIDSGKAIDTPVIVDNTNFPSYEFRGAWEINGTEAVENINKAKVIQTERIDNAKRIKAKDLTEREMMGEDVTVEKVQLRGINTNAVNNANSIAQLKAAWPSF